MAMKTIDDFNQFMTTWLNDNFDLYEKRSNDGTKIYITKDVDFGWKNLLTYYYEVGKFLSYHFSQDFTTLYMGRMQYLSSYNSVTLDILTGMTYTFEKGYEFERSYIVTISIRGNGDFNDYALTHELGHAINDHLKMYSGVSDADTYKNTITVNNKSLNNEFVADEFAYDRGYKLPSLDEFTDNMYRHYNIVCYIMNSFFDKHESEFKNTVIRTFYKGLQLQLDDKISSFLIRKQDKKLMKKQLKPRRKYQKTYLKK